jgi:hypothetical protein
MLTFYDMSLTYAVIYYAFVRLLKRDVEFVGLRCRPCLIRLPGVQMS